MATIDDRQRRAGFRLERAHASAQWADGTFANANVSAGVSLPASGPSLSVMGALHPPVSVEIGEASDVIRERMDASLLTLGSDRRLSIRKIDGARNTIARKKSS